MAALPHDVTDLHLAPVALAIDAKIDELGHLELADLARRIERYRTVEEPTADQRAHWLLQEVQEQVDTFQWQLSLDARGIRLTHNAHSFVLGVPDTFPAYVEGLAAITA